MKQDLKDKYKDLIGKRLQNSRLTLTQILDETSKDGSYSRLCLATCECGRVIKRKLVHVLNGHIKSCGECGLKSESVSKAALNDLTGRTIGYLKVLRRVDGVGMKNHVRHRSAVYECECTYKGCGNHLIALSDMILNEDVSTCGKCGYENDRKQRKVERAIPISDETALRKRFSGMKQRCYNPKSMEYKNYGARGVTICEEWLGDVNNFITWSKNNGFRQDLTIERINDGVYKKNQDGPYAPWNCTWIPISQQASNTRSCRFIDVAGTDTTISDCAKLLGIDPRRVSEMSDRDISIKATRKVLDELTDKLIVKKGSK